MQVLLQAGASVKVSDIVHLASSDKFAAIGELLSWSHARADGARKAVKAALTRIKFKD